MNSKKRVVNTKNFLAVALISLVISYLIIGMLTGTTFNPAALSVFRLKALLHTWLTFVSSYYLYNYALLRVFNRFKSITQSSIVISLVIVSLIVFAWVLLSELIFYKAIFRVESLTSDTSFMTFDVPIAALILILGSFYFYQKHYQRSISLRDSEVRFKKFKGLKGSSQVFLDQKQIGLFLISNKIVWIYSKNGDLYSSDYNLQQVLDQLDEKDFFRLNRQAIVSRDCIAQTGSSSFQKVDVKLIPSLNYQEPLVVSKYVSPAFKKWLTNSA